MRLTPKLIALLHKVGFDRNGLWLAKRYPQYDIGVGTYGHPKIYDWGQGTRLIIGRYCSIAPNVTIFLGGEHRTDWITTYPFNILNHQHRAITGHPATKGNVTIGHDVWLGFGATIFSGVTIGNGAVVAGKAVITKDVPPYTIVGGNPQRTIKPRFEPSLINKIESTRWWELPEHILNQLVPSLMSHDAEQFLAHTAKLKAASPTAYEQESALPSTNQNKPNSRK